MMDKTQYIYFHRKCSQVPRNLEVILNNIPSRRCNSVNFLGVTLSDTLNWHEHISFVCLKISRYIGILNRLKFVLPVNTLFNIYNAFILSTLSYCNSVWANTYPSHLDKLIKLQKKAIRICTNSHYMSHSSPLFKRLRTLKLHDVNNLQIASIMQRYNTNTLPRYLMDMFYLNLKIHNYSTRNANKFHRWVYSNDISKYSLRHSGPIIWNILTAKNFNIAFNNTFRRQYKRHF